MKYPWVVPVFTAPDGVRLHYEVEGEGPPLLLHLGAGCDADLWRAAGYVEPLAKSYECILFDHRGHGRSDHPAETSANHIDRYVDDVIGLVHSMGYESVAFFGWSNAVLVALKAAEQRPGLFCSMVLFGPVPPARSRAELELRSATRAAELRQRGWWVLLDGFLPAEKTEVPQWMVDRIVATDIEPYIAWSEARPTWDWNAWDAMPNIDVPSLLIVGELEDPDDLMGAAASAMPRATGIRIPDREHLNAFLWSEGVLPHVERHLAATVPR